MQLEESGFVFERMAELNAYLYSVCLLFMFILVMHEHFWSLAFLVGF